MLGDSKSLLKPDARRAPRVYLTVKKEFAFACLLALMGNATSQMYSQADAVWRDSTAAPPDPYRGPPDGTSDVFRRKEQQMIAKHALEEYVQMMKEIESDSNKLFKLAAQLNSEISQSSRDSLTEDEAKKFAEIGKLARKVRKEMATCARGF